MSLDTLARRRSQIALLSAACKQRCAARIAVRETRTTPTTIQTHMLCVERNAIWVDWPANEAEQTLQTGCPVDVFFDHEGSRFAFAAQVRGRRVRGLDGLGERQALELSLPARIDRKQQRESCRVSLAALGSIRCRMTSMLSADRTLDCRLLNLSQGGIAALSDWDAIDGLEIGEIYWSEFELPGDSEIHEFAVRLAHRRRSDDKSRGIVGWAFCGSDDQTMNRERLRRIRRHVAQAE
jgi:c-di-GMP-binding flagellar brake protein YcgR